jgi:hypothetical protein
LLAEGALSVWPSIMTLEPESIRVDITDAVLFRVVDSLEAKDTSRGEYPRPVPGLVRPMLHWETRYEPEPANVAMGQAS